MSPDQLYEWRRGAWQQLTQLLDRATQSRLVLSADEVAQLGNLYRAASSDLALAQRDFPQHRVTAYLNQLVGRAHAIIYRHEPLGWQRLGHFVTTNYPRLFRETAVFFVVAMLLFVVPALITALFTYFQPETATTILPADAHQLIPLIEDQELWVDIPVGDRPYASSFIMTNNIQVAFLAFAGGVLGGVTTVYVMIYNGLLVGGLTGLTSYYGVGGELWAFIIGHGVVELTVIWLAGGTGLMLGWAILRPGLRQRRDQLALTANKAVRLLVGCVPLLVIAGTIEGFISPAENVPPLAKWLVGMGTGVLLYSYLLLAGREDS